MIGTLIKYYRTFVVGEMKNYLDRNEVRSEEEKKLPKVKGAPLA